MDTRIIIVGGGVGGLACAWFLIHRQGVAASDILLLEAGPGLGGVTRSRRRAGFLLEEGPDSIISAKPAGVALAEAVGLADHLQGTRPEARRSLIARGRGLHPVPEGLYLMAPGRFLPLALTPLISWPGKLRMGLDLVLPRRPAAAPEESLGAFVRRRLGREALARFAQPMVGGIYTADPEELSVAATMPQFLEMERVHRSLVLAMRQRSRAGAARAAGPRYGLFVTSRGGLHDLVDALVAGLAGVRIQTDTPVTGLEPGAAGGWHLATDRGPQRAERLVLAVPAHAAARLLAGASPRLAHHLGAIPYAGIATLNVALDGDAVRRCPQGAGFVVPAVDHQALVACTFCNQKYAGRAPEGTHLWRGFLGGALHPEDLERDDDTIRARVLGELDWRFGLRGAPRFTHLVRWPAAMAQYRRGHLGRVALIERLAQRAGVHLVGNGYRGVGIPDIVAGAERVAAALTS